MNILDYCSYKCGVSSVLNKDVKQHGKHFMLDSEDETAWSSNEGTPQWISLQFEEPQTISAFSFQFQGGFAGKDASLMIEAEDGEVLANEPFYPEDINSVQSFQLETQIGDKKATKIRFLFKSSTDFFGRIIIYKLEVFP